MVESFSDKLHATGQSKLPTPASLEFLSDPSAEERVAFEQVWPMLPTERRRYILKTLAEMAEDNIDFFFRPIFIMGLEDSDPQVRLAAIEGLFEDNSKGLLFKLVNILQHDPDDDMRESAARSLGRFTYLAECDKLGKDAGTLRQALLNSAKDEDEDEDVRRRAVEALGYLSGDQEVQDLLVASYEQGGRQAESAVFAMGRNMNERWQQIVMNELDSDHPAMRYEAARAAGEMTLEDALPLLVRMINDRDTEVRLAAIWALGQIGGKPAVEALSQVAKSPEPAVREAAEEALDEISFSANPIHVLG